MTRLLLDGRLLESGTSGVKDIAEGLVRGLREVARQEGHDLLVAGTTIESDIRLSGRGFMHLELPRAAAQLRCDSVIIPRQTRPAASPVRCIPLFHDIGFLTLPQLYPRTRAVRLANWHAMGARDALTVSSFTADELVAVGAGARPAVLPFGAMHEIEWMPSEERPYLLCIAAQEPHKNLVRLLRAWATVDAAGCRLVICGRAGGASSTITATVQRFGLTGSVEVVQGLSDDDYRRLLSGSWGYIQPSFYEGLCIPALDMAAAGVPTMVSDRANLGRVFASSAPGQVFDPDSTEQIAEALTALVFDSATRSAVSSWNRENIHVTDWLAVGRSAWEVAA